ncbi:hypothetical protein BS50DRAFT_57477 [Corynespora cassiicola Philippines]|uniref:Uncharacterized protein n=1 Tax=Corynespora cassiicola Philippines TaxID=1448308 RepID=A0A2T2NJ02_CORCC|nr:hypothetical protein BS50DRAFT_57477 [Corynespora cassiicola Philippines]
MNPCFLRMKSVQRSDKKGLCNCISQKKNKACSARNSRAVASSTDIQYSSQDRPESRSRQSSNPTVSLGQRVSRGEEQPLKRKHTTRSINTADPLPSSEPQGKNSEKAYVYHASQDWPAEPASPNGSHQILESRAWAWGHPRVRHIFDRVGGCCDVAVT